MNEPAEVRDNSEQTVTILEWCAGYSGIGMGIRRVVKDLRTIGYSEIEEYPITVLASLMEKGLIDAAPIWTNLKSFPYETFRGKVDILVAGFPCQPFSHAGKRAGDEDPRHLWPYISRAVGIIRPRYVFCENVEGIMSAKLAGSGWADPEGTPVLLHVLRELERLGYRSTAGLFSAAECGAPHNRKRVFICGMDDSQMHRCKCGIFDPSNVGRLDIPVAGTDLPWPTGPNEDQQLWEPARAILVPRSGTAADDDGDAGDGPDDGGDGECGATGCETGDVGDAECVRPDGRGDEGEVGGPCCPPEGEGVQSTEAAQDPGTMVNAAGGGDGQYQAEQQGRDPLGRSGEAGGELGDPQELLSDGGQHDARGSEPSGQVPELGDAGGQAAMGDPGLLGQEVGQVPPTGPEQRGEGDRDLGNAAGTGQSPCELRQGQGEVGGTDSGQDANAEVRDGEAVQPLGGDPDGSTARVGVHRLPGLSDYELAQICEWMQKTPNRAEELKMLGNGVVPAVSEKAWRTLVKRLWDGKVGV